VGIRQAKVSARASARDRGGKSARMVFHPMSGRHMPVLPGAR
jgi:hypothetical protein